MAYTETKVSGETLYKGKIISLHRDIVRLQNGKDTVREVVEHPGGVCILPVDSEGNILFVRQYRYPHKTELYELPAGKRDSDEDPAVSARRELAEETGCTAEHMSFLGTFLPSTAYLTEVIHLYYAEKLSFIGQNLDEDEFLSVVRIPFEKAVDMVLMGELPDGKTQAAVLKVAALKASGNL